MVRVYLVFFSFLIGTVFNAHTATTPYDVIHLSAEYYEAFSKADSLFEIHAYESSIKTWEELAKSPSLSIKQELYINLRLSQLQRKVFKDEQSELYLNKVEDILNGTMARDSNFLVLYFLEKGEYYARIGKYLDAEVALNKAQELKEQIEPQYDFVTARIHTELGEFYAYRLADYNMALPYYNNVVSYLERSGHSSHFSATAYYNLAASYYYKYELEYAFKMAKKALEYEESLQHPKGSFLCNVNSFLGSICTEQNDHDAAIAYGFKTIDLTKRYKSNNLSALYREQYLLALSFRNAGQFDAANQILIQIIDNLERKNLVDRYSLRYYLSHLSISSNYAMMKEGKKALNHLNIVLKNTGKIYEKCSDSYLMMAQNIADNLVQIGYYENAYSTLKGLFDCTSINTEINEWSKIYAKKANIESNLLDQNPYLLQSLNNYLIADSLLKKIKLKSTWSSSVIEQSETHYDFYLNAINASFRAYELNPQKEYLELVLKFMESNKSFAVFQSLNESITLNNNLEGNRLSGINQINNRISMWESMLNTSSDNRFIDSLEKYKRLKEDYISGIEGDLFEKNISSFYERIPTLSAIQQGLDDESVIVQFKQIEDDSFLRYVIRHDTAFIQNIHVDSIESFIRVFRDFFPRPFTPTMVTDYAASSFKLYQSLFGETVKSYTNVTIIPDGILNYLPFDALINDDSYKTTRLKDFSQLKYMILEQRINYAYSLSQLYNLSKRNDKHSSIFSAYDRGTTLGNSYEEHKSISRLFDQVYKPDLDQNKNEWFSHLKQAEVLHFSTHTLIDSNNYNLNQISINNSLSIYAYEIGSMDINADLAFINGCESYLGKEYKGEGIFSLARQFFQSDCPSVIANLWKISDKTAALLSVDIFQYLKKGDDIPSALYLAKNDFIKNPDLGNIYKHPYYWAGTISIGDPSPINIPNKTSNRLKTIIILLIALAVFALFGRRIFK